MKITDDSLYCAPVALLWSRTPENGSPARYLHSAYRSELWRDEKTAGRLKLVLRAAAVPLALLTVGTVMTWRNARAISRRTGRSVPAQIADQIVLAFRYGVLPPWYYMFDLHKAGNRERAVDYLHRYETKYNLYELLKVYREKTGGRPLSDKSLYASICAGKGVRTPEIVAVGEEGQVRAWSPDENAPEEPPRWPEADMFIKPRDGKGGRGTTIVKWAGDGQYNLSDGSSLTPEELGARIADMSREMPYIVQKRLFNHPDMIDMCSNALCCIRIMTIRTRDDRFVVTHGVLRMALDGSAVVDGLHRGGLISSVNVETGELGPATNLGLRPEIGWCEVNPVTGAQIAGRMLPMWPETRAAAEAAHAAFPYKVTVGWDVAITPDGPVVVEGNGSPCVDIIQRSDCEPMGPGLFGQELAYHVSEAIAEKDAILAGRS